MAMISQLCLTFFLKESPAIANFEHVFADQMISNMNDEVVPVKQP